MILKMLFFVLFIIFLFRFITYKKDIADYEKDDSENFDNDSHPALFLISLTIGIVIIVLLISLGIKF
jgi:tellurite resistance protein TehA-like permease